MNLGQMIDERNRLKSERAAAQKVVDDLESRMKSLEADILSAMREAGLDIAAGHSGKVAVKQETQPNVHDWALLHQYVRDNNAFFLLQKRVTATAFREALDAGLEIPGVRGVPVTSLSFTSI